METRERHIKEGDPSKRPITLRPELSDYRKPIRIYQGKLTKARFIQRAETADTPKMVITPRLGRIGKR